MHSFEQDHDAAEWAARAEAFAALADALGGDMIRTIRVLEQFGAPSDLVRAAAEDAAITAVRGGAR